MEIELRRDALLPDPSCDKEAKWTAADDRLNDLQPKATKGRSKPAPVPYGTKKAAKPTQNPLFEKRTKTFGIGGPLRAAFH